VKISRTLLFLANLARAIPVNPLMLIDTAHHTAGCDATHEVAADRPVLPHPATDKFAEAPADKSAARRRG
jgi:hypothetical protein